MTFNDFVVDVQEEANDVSARMKGLIERWVNDEYVALCRHRDWDFLAIDRSDEETIAPAGMPFDPAGFKVATITTPGSNVLGVFDTTDGDEEPLGFTTLAELRATFPGYTQTTGTPACWYWENGKVNVYPALGASRKFRFAFIKKAVAITGTTVFLIPDEWIHVLMHKVLIRVWSYLSDDRYEVAVMNHRVALKDMKQGVGNKTRMQYSPDRADGTRVPRLVTV